MSIHTGATIDRDLALECDVCVVGSGAGGAHVAARLAAAGKKVIVLEEGGFHTSDTFDMKESTMTPRLYQERGWRATADGAIGVLQGRAVGGTTVVNWTTCFRTPKRVFEHWAEHHGVEGPTHDALLPHWRRVEERLNVQPVKEEQLNENNRVLLRGARKLGWRAELLSRNVKGCAQSGYCGMGCPIDAKQSMLVTMIPDAVRSGADVYANVWVERVERDGRKATRVVARVHDVNTDRLTSRTVVVRAKIVVLSAGGINTPAILLRSGIDASGRVGKRTFLHPAAAAAGIHDREVEGYNGAPQYVGCSEFSERPPEKMSFLMETTPIFPVMTAASNFEFGRAHQEMMDLLPRLGIVNAILADGFDPSERDDGGTVTLRSSGRPRLDYLWTRRLTEGLREATRRIAEVQLAGGARSVYSVHARPVIVRSAAELSLLDEAPYGPNEVGVFSAHVMGGCAMGTDSTRTVVDSRTLRLHELDNLFVVDGSVFPTSLGVNPQLSIYGLASWASEHVKAAVA